MSWFTDLAGKAEDFLVKIDQNAAVAAQALAKDKTSSVNTRSPSPNLQIQMSTVENKNESSVVSNSLSLKASLTTNDLPKLSKQPTKVDRDAELMASLNQSNTKQEMDNLSVGSNGELISTNGNGISLQQENQLLKQEIKSLCQEIRQAMQCAKQAERDNKAAQLQLKSQGLALQTAEEQLSTLRSENMQLADQVMGKDAEICSVKGQLEAMHFEQEHQVKLETLQQQLEKEAAKRQAAESEVKLVLGDSEQQKCMLQAELQHIHQQLQGTKEELSVTQQSFNEYKLRAQRILQDKDKLLQDVKDQHSDQGLQPSEFLKAELLQLHQERDLLRVEVSQANFQLQNLREELELVKQKYEEEVRSLRESSLVLENRVAEEREKKKQIEIESRQLNEELRYIREDMAQQRIQTATRIQQQESEISKLRQQLANKQNSTSSSSEAELERRLRSLTETLVAKQAALEAVQSERSSLFLQLERAMKTQSTEEHSLFHNPGGGEHSTRVMLNNITDDAKATGVSRRVRYAYSTLDSLNFRLGQALRRRPAARGILFAYMILLHFWVAFVLLTYSPEVHGSTHDASIVGNH